LSDTIFEKQKLGKNSSNFDDCTILLLYQKPFINGKQLLLQEVPPITKVESPPVEGKKSLFHLAFFALPTLFSSFWF